MLGTELASVFAEIAWIFAELAPRHSSEWIVNMYERVNNPVWGACLRIVYHNFTSKPLRGNMAKPQGLD